MQIIIVNMKLHAIRRTIIFTQYLKGKGKVYNISVQIHLLEKMKERASTGKGRH